MTTRPSKRAVKESIAAKFAERCWTYKEAGPDSLAWFHCWVEVSEGDRVIATIHATPGKTMGGARANMIAVMRRLG
jgi:hypothetical protein